MINKINLSRLIREFVDKVILYIIVTYIPGIILTFKVHIKYSDPILIRRLIIGNPCTMINTFPFSLTAGHVTIPKREFLLLKATQNCAQHC